MSDLTTYEHQGGISTKLAGLAAEAHRATKLRSRASVIDAVHPAIEDESRVAV